MSPHATHKFSAIDASAGKGAHEKALLLTDSAPRSLIQEKQLSNRQHCIILEERDQKPKSYLGDYAEIIRGLSTGETNRFYRQFWELSTLNPIWDYLRDTTLETTDFGGMSYVIRWENEAGELAKLAESLKHLNHAVQSWRRGKPYWGRVGVSINRMASLAATRYLGEKFTDNVGIIVPRVDDHLDAVWEFCSSPEFKAEVSLVNPKLAVEPRYFSNVPFDLAHWKQVSKERNPCGLPKPYSNDPTQWIFHGHPRAAVAPLQVAVARLLGYTWPAESDDQMELSDDARQWTTRSKALAPHADKDGIVCIPPVGRESAASDRLLNLLADAYGEAWSNDVLAQLLTAADHAGKSLETWLRDKFFTQHCALFGNRPFVWQIWDGLRDGFAALVNYHKLDYKTLEALIYTYLGDWISRQKRDAESGVDGAQEKLAAAEALKKRLELILAGEAPYDIFVRWKPIEQQPIGWNPDLNDGVRLNIRPFISVPDVGKKGAGVLRDKPKSLHWEKDRGSDVPSAPWYELGLQYDGKVGDRINDHHLTLAEKQAARAKKGA